MGSPENNEASELITEHLSKLKITKDAKPSVTLSIDMETFLDGASAMMGSQNSSNPNNGRFYAKLLVNNSAAGSIIGKAGATINEFQAKTLGRIQLSKSGEYYPGTSERTLLVSGRLHQIICALDLIFAKLKKEAVASVTPRTRSAIESNDTEFPDYHLAVRFLVPQPLCGIIIGKGGQTIRTYSNDTNTQIRVTAPEQPTLPLNHRVVSITGAPDSCLKAIALLLLKQSEDAKYLMFSELPSSYVGGPAAAQGVSGVAYPYAYVQQQQHPQMGYTSGHHSYYGNGPAENASQNAGMYPNSGAQAIYTPNRDGTATMSFPVTEEQAKILVGKQQSPHPQGGRHGASSPISIVEELENGLGVRIAIETSGETSGSGSPSSGFSQVSISGTAESLQYANFMIYQRLAMAMMQHQYAAAGYYNLQQQYYQAGGQQYHGQMQYNPQMQYGHYGSGNVEQLDSNRKLSPRTVMVMTPRSYTGDR